MIGSRQPFETLDLGERMTTRYSSFQAQDTGEKNSPRKNRGLAHPDGFPLSRSQGLETKQLSSDTLSLGNCLEIRLRAIRKPFHFPSNKWGWQFTSFIREGCKGEDNSRSKKNLLLLNVHTQKKTGAVRVYYCGHLFAIYAYVWHKWHSPYAVHRREEFTEMYFSQNSHQQEETPNLLSISLLKELPLITSRAKKKKEH